MTVSPDQLARIMPLYDRKWGPTTRAGQEGGQGGVKCLTAPLHSRVKGLVVNPRDPGGLCQREALAVQLNPYGVASVAGLLRPGCPAAVAGGIGAVIVNALQSAARRLRPHVAEERREARAPLRMHGDPATAVTWILRAVRIFATLFGVAPALVFGRCAPALGMAMCGGSGAGDLAPKASAASHDAPRHGAGNSVGFRAAIAFEHPAAAVTHAPERDKSVKALTWGYLNLHAGFYHGAAL